MHNNDTSHVNEVVLLHYFILNRVRTLQPKPASQHKLQVLFISHFASSLSELGLTKQMLLQALDGEPSNLRPTDLGASMGWVCIT